VPTIIAQTPGSSRLVIFPDAEGEFPPDILFFCGARRGLLSVSNGRLSHL